MDTPYPDSAAAPKRRAPRGANHAEYLLSWYGADERLRVVDRRTCYVFQPVGHTAACDPKKQPMPNERSAFEEYRYDALGRRVLVRTRQEHACTSTCVSALRRTVWDGDQVLAEVQAPGYTHTPTATLERDTGFRIAAASLVNGEPVDDRPGSTSEYYPGYFFGRVIYTHGAGIDHPLSITRMEYSDSLPGPITLYPHENWKGAFDLGSYAGGTTNPPCRVVGYKYGLVTRFQTWTPGPGEPSSPPDTLYHCLKVDWPAPHLWLTNRRRDNSWRGAESWNGSLIDGMRHASGQIYQRNRFYDPQTGRFTQRTPSGSSAASMCMGLQVGIRCRIGIRMGCVLQAQVIPFRPPPECA